MRRVRSVSRAVLSVALAVTAGLVVAACEPDAATAPTSLRPGGPLFELEDGRDPGCNDTDFLCEDDPGDTGYEEYVGTVDGESHLEVSISPIYEPAFYTSSEYATTGQPAECLPGLSQSGVTATIRRTMEANLVIVSSGWWPIIYGELPPGYGRYLWPRGPHEGFWPALDPNDKRRGFIDTGDCHCWLEKRRPDYGSFITNSTGITALGFGIRLLRIQPAAGEATARVRTSPPTAEVGAASTNT